MKNEFMYYSDLVPTNQYRTKEGIRGKNARLLWKYQQEGSNKEETLNELIVNNLPLAYAITERWTSHEEVSNELKKDLRQSAILELCNYIKSEKFTVNPKEFSVKIFYRMTYVFCDYFKNSKNLDIYSHNFHEDLDYNLDLDKFESDDFIINTDLDSLCKNLKNYMAILTEREYDVLDFYYRENMSEYEIGMRFGLTRERVRQIHEKALKKLRRGSVEYRINPITGLWEVDHYDNSYLMNVLKAYL